MVQGSVCGFRRLKMTPWAPRDGLTPSYRHAQADITGLAAPRVYCVWQGMGQGRIVCGTDLREASCKCGFSETLLTCF